MSNEDSIPPIDSYEDYKKLTSEQQAKVDSWGSEDLDKRLADSLQEIEIQELSEEDRGLKGKDDKMGAA